MPIINRISDRFSVPIDLWPVSVQGTGAAMSIIEATKNEAEVFYAKYDNITKSFLATYMYQWDAMPLLSLIGNKQNPASLQVAPDQQ